MRSSESVHKGSSAGRVTKMVGFTEGILKSYLYDISLVFYRRGVNSTCY